MPERLTPSRLSARNILHTAVVGVNMRRNRSIMSAIGIAIGIAAIDIGQHIGRELDLHAVVADRMDHVVLAIVDKAAIAIGDG